MGHKLTRTAEDDLISIYVEGAALFGRAQAASYHDALGAIFTFLGEHPAAARERTEITPPVRCHPHAAHIIVYLVDEDGDALILRIRHAREDWENDPL
jgi:toxin ParE1/3/4